MASMKLFVNLPKLSVGEVRVDLRSGDIFMAKKFLDTSQNRTMRKEIGSVAMAEGVGSNFF